jgi:hypothetical protein
MRTSFSGLVGLILFCWALGSFGWGPVLIVTGACVALAVLVGVPLACIVGLLNYRFFSKAADRAAEKFRNDTQAEKAAALKEIGRLNAHVKRGSAQAVLWSNN